MIISNFFFPKNQIASFRINAFARYFHKAGHEVTVVTEGNCDSTTFWEGCEVHYLKDPVMTDQQLRQCAQFRRKWVLRRIVHGLQGRLTLDKKRLWRIRAQKCVKRLLDSQYCPKRFGKIAAFHKILPDKSSFEK